MPIGREIKLLRNNDNLDLSDIEWLESFYNHMQKDLKISKKKAFSVIYYLQEHLCVFPDHIEQCNTCGQLYDSCSRGHHSEMLGRFYCSEDCEPRGLWEKEQRWEKRRSKKKATEGKQEGGGHE